MNERCVMTNEQKEKALYFALELRHHSQNNEMVDQYYTQLGTLLNETAEFLEELVKSQEPDYTGCYD